MIHTHLKQRDTQVKRLYKAEQVLNQKARPLETIPEVEAFLLYIFTDDWFKAHFPDFREFKVYDGRRRRSACGWGYYGGGTFGLHKGAAMRLPRHSRKDWVVLHELAHGLQPENTAWHGPEFAGIYVRLVQQYMGEEAVNALLASFHEHRVKYTLPEARQVSGRWV